MTTQVFSPPFRWIVVGLAAAAIGVAGGARGHGLPLLVAPSVDGGLTLLNQPPRGRLVNDGFELVSEDPGIGVLGTRPTPQGTVLGLETLGGLLHWDGDDVAPATGVLTLEAPEFDGLGNPNQTAVAEYRIGADTGPLSGLTWHTYPGGTWDAHGLYALPAEAPAGVYGFAARVVASSLGASEPVLIPLVHDPADAWAEFEEAQAVALLREAALAAPPPGDYDGDGAVTALDFDAWRSAFGGVGAADGNRDAVVDAADYVVLRDLVAPAGVNTAEPIPEPGGAALLAAVLAFALGVTGLAGRRRKSSIPFLS